MVRRNEQASSTCRGRRFKPRPIKASTPGPKPMNCPLGVTGERTSFSQPFGSIFSTVTCSSIEIPAFSRMMASARSISSLRPLDGCAGRWRRSFGLVHGWRRRQPGLSPVAWSPEIRTRPWPTSDGTPSNTQHVHSHTPPFHLRLNPSDFLLKEEDLRFRILD